ncbi:MCE family protein [Sphingomonas sp. TF3]|uniref:MlaD family protein n=1 Tax=Sphingomonas sp. TF3 TaxID=2495580 RepID=UPI000F88986D|nr:MlaD family protein [Sphingomonas sp. TF3]RUN75469.1 MCE family protein [Sphingomonas sp. TF3]
METRSNRLLVFAVVGVLLATLLVFAGWLFSGSNPDGREYLIRFKDSVTGVSKGSPVTFSGVPAGSVTAVRLAENDPSTVLVKVRLDPDIPIVRGVEATVSRSFIGGDSTVTLDGARKGAPPIVPVTGERLPVIPAKKGGLLGSGGDPLALIEKISRSVDNVSSNLDGKGQERVRARLALLAERSAGWSDRVPRIFDGLTETSGKVQRGGDSIASAGEGADRLRTRIEAERGSGLRSLRERLHSAESAAEAFGAKVEAARPTIRRIEVQRQTVTDQVRSVRATTQRVQEQAQRIDREGLQLFGTPKLPDYKPGGGAAAPLGVQPPPR